MLRTLITVFALFILSFAKAQNTSAYQLVWSDEFNNNGAPDTTNWAYEHGFVRNEEAQ